MVHEATSFSGRGDAAANAGAQRGGVRGKLAAVVSAGVAAGLMLTLGIFPANADKLDDRKDRIEKQIAGTEKDLESVNAMLEKNGAKLREFQDKLPAAEAAVREAEAAESAARSEAEQLQGRLVAAEQSRAEMVQAQDETKALTAEQRKLTGQLAARAYQSGGFEGSDLALLMRGSDLNSWASSVEVSSRLARAQNRELNQLLGRGAEQRNATARLSAVEDEISGLKQQADAALARQTQAREAADAAKADLDQLLDETEKAQAELEDAKSKARQQLEEQKAEQAKVNQEIKERQERLKREAEERARKAREAAAKAQREAEAAERRRAKNAAALRAKAQAAQKKATTATNNTKVSKTVSKGTWGLVVPATSGPITSGYGWRPTPAGTIDYGGMGGYVHAGIDWGSRCGAPIIAAADGRVMHAGWKGMSGIVVSVDHNIVNGHALTTNYHHMTRTAVSVGQKVKRGQVIGYVGTTGNSTGCHLHFETIVNGKHRNPAGLLW